MYLNSKDINEYVKSELVDWLSDPVLINTPTLITNSKKKFEINFLPDSRVVFNIQLRDNNTFSIHWIISVTTNQDYLPEDTTVRELIQDINNTISQYLSSSEKEDISLSNQNDNLNYSQILMLVNTNELAKRLNFMVLKEVSCEFGSTEIYLDKRNPEKSIDKILKYNNIDEVYDIIFDSSLEDELNIHLNQ